MFKIEKNIPKTDIDFIRNKTREHNKKNGLKMDEDFSFCIRDENGEIISGLYGGMFFGFAYIDYFWTDEKYRGKGLGTKLMNELEAEAKKKECRYLVADTMEYQSPQFYKKYGFDLSLELKNCEGGNTHYTLAKKII